MKHAFYTYQNASLSTFRSYFQTITEDSNIQLSIGKMIVIQMDIWKCLAQFAKVYIKKRFPRLTKVQIYNFGYFWLQINVSSENKGENKGYVYIWALKVDVILKVLFTFPVAI